MPELSVLMPARNASATIERAVRSTLSAMPGDSELVVLDDGSTDGTSDVLDRVGDRRLRVVRNDTGSGVAGALQQLVGLTDSRVVSRMDADDVTLPGRFSAQAGALDEGADVVWAAVVRFSGRLRDLRPTTPLRLGSDALSLGMLLTNPLSHPTLYVRRSVLDAVGGYAQSLAEDYDLWLRLAASGASMVRMRRTVLAYREHPGQTSGAVGWTETALAEQQLQDSYDALSQRLLHVDRRDESTFRGALRTAAFRMKGNQGRWLRHRLRTSTVLEQMIDLQRARTAS